MAITRLDAEFDRIQYISAPGCTYRRFGKRVKYEGNLLGQRSPYSETECQEICDNTVNCQSFAYQPNTDKCWLYDRKLYGGEEQITHDNVYTVFKSDCGKYDNENFKFSFILRVYFMSLICMHNLQFPR